MKTIERIKLLDERLLTLFDKMIRGIKIELNSKGKEMLNKYCTDRWWYIQSIGNDYINICSTNHFITSVKLDEVK